MGQVSEAAEVVAPYQPNEAERKLIEALRSGRYEQTTCCLRDALGYCCLGVAEDVLNPEPWRMNSLGTRWFKGDGVSYYLTSKTRDLLGWSDNAGLLIGGEGGACLASRNDAGATFSEIADMIEQGKVLRV